MNDRRVTLVEHLPEQKFESTRIHQNTTEEGPNYAIIKAQITYLGKSRSRKDNNSLYESNDGGRRGIRTPGTVSGSAVFKTAALDHSAILPRQ